MTTGGRSGGSRGRSSTHYEVLGVARTADHDAIRRAYLAAARRWHPDRVGGASDGESAAAETAMRRINEAWSVLGRADSRREYDQQLVAGAAGRASGGSSGGFDVDDDDPRIRRIDPRLIDPEFLAARRDMQLNEISDRSAMAVRAFPVLLVLALMIGIFVVTAYAGNRGDSSPVTTMPGPSLGAGIEANDCVDIIGGPTLLEVPCGSTADGLVIGAHLGDGSCPLGTIRELELSNGVWVCLGAV